MAIVVDEFGGTLLDWRPRALSDIADLRARFAPPPEQLQLI